MLLWHQRKASRLHIALQLHWLATFWPADGLPGWLVLSDLPIDPELPLLEVPFPGTCAMLWSMCGPPQIPTLFLCASSCQLVTLCLCEAVQATRHIVQRTSGLSWLTWASTYRGVGCLVRHWFASVLLRCHLHPWLLNQPLSSLLAQNRRVWGSAWALVLALDCSRAWRATSAASCLPDRHSQSQQIVVAMPLRCLLWTFATVLRITQSWQRLSKLAKRSLYHPLRLQDLKQFRSSGLVGFLNDLIQPSFSPLDPILLFVFTERLHELLLLFM